MTRDEWIAAFARGAGVEPPSQREIRELLELALRLQGRQLRKLWAAR